MDRLFSSRTIAGGIVMGDYLDPSLIGRLLGQGHKIVLYNEYEKSDHENLIVVNYDNFKCGKIACDELIKRGHKKIAHVTGSLDKFGVRGRLEGLKASMCAAGLTFDEEHYLGVGSYHRESGGYEATKRLLKNNQHNLPTAILAATSIMMLGALHAINDVGLRVPNDISLIGIDAMEVSKYTTPALTEVITSEKSIAVVTVTKLIKLLEDGNLDIRDFEIADASLAIRDSILTVI